ncbi:SIR2 family NAD-dependent protein deacylase [Mobilicoccus pelagius]|uniref:NAD-dependent protein deacylase n=1 Tax=Mobilicoccus pelagius NBRC 104925 TaxID=1089455 RepID=H5UT51_9MICO|nr:NAD-dependent deacylase [Mobilicoccus pelagius]GAB48909.1 putative NAD-dependent deacetylase [Mobilicoccus pelagius NBRC 104925]
MTSEPRTADQHPSDTSSQAATDPVVPPEILDLARAARRVTVLTGAGMSAESGVPTFRGAEGSLWEEFDPIALASPKGWDEDPELVWAWYAWRMGLARGVDPNAGHRALAQWAAAGDAEVVIATQNIDDLHERAGSDVLAHVHGSLFAVRCSMCDAPYTGEVDIPAEPVQRLEPPLCEECGEYVRPGVVWFGEMLPEGAFDAAVDACLETDLVLVVGTSGIVYPFASLPDIARGHGVPVVEINPADTELSEGVDHVWRATAATALPALVEALATR